MIDAGSRLGSPIHGHNAMAANDTTEQAPHKVQYKVMKVLIVDDEPLARERLRYMLGRIPAVTSLIEEAANGAEAVQLAERLRPDIVLMDIHMPGMAGLEAAGHIGQLECPPAVIFCTAYDQHAIEAFQVQAVGYLLKPVKRNLLEEALKQASRVNRSQMSGIRNQETTEKSQRTHISARTHNGLTLIPVADILYFLADKKYTTVCHSQGEILIDEPLKSLQKQLGDQFVRIHRNALVAQQAIESLTRTSEGIYEIRLCGVDTPLVVSRRHVALLRKQMKNP